MLLALEDESPTCKTEEPSGLSWMLPNDVLTVGVCETIVQLECVFGCTCTQPDDTECDSVIVTEAPDPSASVSSINLIRSLAARAVS
jgi:hypothetical protein